MISKKQRSIPLGGRYVQVSLYMFGSVVQRNEYSSISHWRPMRLLRHYCDTTVDCQEQIIPTTLYYPTHKHNLHYFFWQIKGIHTSRVLAIIFCIIFKLEHLDYSDRKTVFNIVTFMLVSSWSLFFKVLLFHPTQQVTRSFYKTKHTLHADINVAVHNGIWQLMMIWKITGYGKGVLSFCCQWLFEQNNVSKRTE